MEYKDILELAYDAALEVWYRERDMLKRDPTNKLLQTLEIKTWEIMKTIKSLLMEEIEKDQT